MSAYSGYIVVQESLTITVRTVSIGPRAEGWSCLTYCEGGGGHRFMGEWPGGGRVSDMVWGLGVFSICNGELLKIVEYGRWVLWSFGVRVRV